MRRQVNLPGQLPLNFNYGFLNWIDLKNESFELYQDTAQKLIANSIHDEAGSPIWKEIVCALNH